MWRKSSAKDASVPSAPALGGVVDEDLAQCGGVHPDRSQRVGDALMIADLGHLRRTRQPPTDSGNDSGQHRSPRQTRSGLAERRHELPPSSWRSPQEPDREILAARNAEHHTNAEISKY
jgi:hypothetical protein